MQQTGSWPARCMHGTAVNRSLPPADLPSLPRTQCWSSISALDQRPRCSVRAGHAHVGAAAQTSGAPIQRDDGLPFPNPLLTWPCMRPPVDDGRLKVVGSSRPCACRLLNCNTSSETTSAAAPLPLSLPASSPAPRSHRSSSCRQRAGRQSQAGRHTGDGSAELPFMPYSLILTPHVHGSMPIGRMPGVVAHRSLRCPACLIAPALACMPRLHASVVHLPCLPCSHYAASCQILPLYVHALPPAVAHLVL